MNYEIVPATMLHVGPLANRLTWMSERIVARGGKPRQWLRWYIGQSNEAKVALVDGEPVLVWGYMGSPLGTQVQLWANFSDTVRRFPLSIVREARKELDRVLELVPEIEPKVIASDVRARRFAEFLGFKVWEDEPVHEGGVLCYPITKRRA